MSEDVVAIESKDHFEQINQTGVVLADFWAPWCAPCRGQLPIVEAVAKAYKGKAKIVKINVDEDTVSELGRTYSIDSIPTLILFKDGKLVERFVGVQSQNVLAASLDRVIGTDS